MHLRAKSIFAGILLTALAGCSSLPIGAGPATPVLDPLKDDLSKLLIAYDLPDTIEAVPGASTLTVGVTAPSGTQNVAAKLVPADFDDVAGTLPDPADGHSYALFGFAPADQAALGKLQAFARTQPPGSARLSVDLAPGLCFNEKIDPASVRVTVLVAAIGGGRLVPLIANTPLATLLAQSPGASLVACAGHSG
jgi:hypothetical protein